MPIYRYRCLECGHEDEILMSLKERKEYEKDLNCPSCASKYYNNIIGKTSFSLLGKGWYKDGYNTK